MGNEFFAHDVAKCVFVFCFLNEEVVFWIKAFADFRALEEEGEPFLNAVETATLSKIHAQSDIESDRSGEDGVTAEEVDLDLHGVSEPAEDINIIPAFFGITARRIVFDANFMAVMAVKFREGFSIEDVFDDGEFGDFFCFEGAWIIEDFAVAVSEDVCGEPAVEAEASSAQAGSDDSFHEGLTCFEVFTHDGDFFAKSEFDEGWCVDGEVGGTVCIGNVAGDSCIGVNHGRADARIIFLHGLFHGFDCLMAVFTGGVAFCGAAPEHEKTIAAVCFFEVFDVIFDHLDEVPFGCSDFGVFNFDIVAVVVIEDSVHRLDGFKLSADGIEMFVFENAGTFADFISIFAVNIPGAEHDVFNVCKGNKVFNKGVAFFGAFSETNTAHLSDGADRETVSGEDVENTSDHGGGDSAKTRNQNTKFAVCRFNINTVSHNYLPLRLNPGTIAGNQFCRIRNSRPDSFQK